jgi:lipopolysaccharide transport system ATP-binding protein
MPFSDATASTQVSPVLEVKDLTKSFALYARPVDRLKEALFKGSRHRIHTAVNGLNFALHGGEALGIIGRNGAGKSSLLKLITGVLEADAGSVLRHGRIAGLLELGTGFDMEATGRENIAINAGLMGLSSQEVQAITPQVVAFAELDDFIDMPVRSYSSGMAMRLGFSIAFHSQPKAFVVDEALSVGDVRFQQKCFQKIQDFKAQGGAILFVSHDLNAVRLLCDRVLVLEKGEIVFNGDPAEAVQVYYKLMAGAASMGNAQPRSQSQSQPQLSAHTSQAPAPTHDPAGPGYGLQQVRIRSALWWPQPQASLLSLASGQWADLEVRLESSIAYQGSLGVLLRDRFGQDVFGVNTAMLGQTVTLQPGETRVFRIRMQLNLAPGLYSVTLAVHTDTTHHNDCQHWWDNALSIDIVGFASQPFSGLCSLPIEIS